MVRRLSRRVAFSPSSKLQTVSGSYWLGACVLPSASSAGRHESAPVVGIGPLGAPGRNPLAAVPYTMMLSTTSYERENLGLNPESAAATRTGTGVNVP